MSLSYTKSHKKQEKQRLFYLLSTRNYFKCDDSTYEYHLNAEHPRDFYTIFYGHSFDINREHLERELKSLKNTKHGVVALNLLEKLIVFRKHYKHVFPGMRHLAQSLGVSIATVSRSIKVLIQRGLIQADRFNKFDSFRYKLAQSFFNPALRTLLSEYLSRSILICFSMLIPGFQSLLSSKCNRIKIKYNEFYLSRINNTTLQEVVVLVNETLDRFWSIVSRKNIVNQFGYLQAMLRTALENYSGELPAHLLVSLLEKGIIAMNPLKAYPSMHSRVSGTPQRQTPPPVAPAPPHEIAATIKERIGDRGLRDAMLNFLAKCATVSPKQGDAHEEDLRHQHTTYSMEESRQVRQAIL